MIVKQIELISERLREAKFLVVLTGAGVSAESGIPTFRGKNGLWRNYRAEELATPTAFKNNPALVWEWYEWRRGLIKKASPNSAHHAISELEKLSSQFLLITQNIDNLHRQAGSQNIVELHGNIFRNKCSECNKIYDELPSTAAKPPRCSCGGLLRPDVVWFGESLPRDALDKSFSAASNCDFMLVVGTSGVVEPAASLPFIAKRGGTFVAVINKDETPFSYIADEIVLGKAGEILPEILKLI
jgi:NAD-dependent deacetylase